MTDGTLSEDHNLRISMENLRLRDDHGNHNKDQMDDIDVSQNLKPEPRSNNSDVLPQDKSRQFLEPEVLAHHNRDAEVDRLLDGKRNRKMKEKGRQSQLAVLEKRRAKLVTRTTRISNEIDNLKYSYQNSVTVKKELAQVNNMFRMLVETHKEQEEIDEEYDDEIWFDNMDQKVFSFKHKVHNWLKEGEKLRKSDQVSRCSSKSSSKYSSKSSAKSSSLSKSRSSTKAKAIEEKVKVPELMMEAFFQQKRRCRVSDPVPYGGGRITQSSSKTKKFMKTKVRLVKAEKQNRQHQMIFIPTKEYPLQKTLTKQNKRKCRMRSGRECSRSSRIQNHLIWQLY